MVQIFSKGYAENIIKEDDYLKRFNQIEVRVIIFFKREKNWKMIMRVHEFERKNLDEVIERINSIHAKKEDIKINILKLILSLPHQNFIS